MDAPVKEKYKIKLEEELQKIVRSIVANYKPEKIGAKHLWFDFDEEADVLYVSLERPQRATDTDTLDDGILLRLRDDNLAGITITNFSKRFPEVKR